MAIKGKRKQLNLIRAAEKGDIGGIRAALADGADPNYHAVQYQVLTGNDMKIDALEMALRGGHMLAARLLMDSGATATFRHFGKREAQAAELLNDDQMKMIRILKGIYQ